MDNYVYWLTILSVPFQGIVYGIVGIALFKVIISLARRWFRG